MSGETVRKRVVVSGRVQGVGFRFFVVEQAELLGVIGWVRNLPDGRVEAEIEGSPEKVDKLLDQLRVGPRLSHVTSLDVQDLDSSGTYKDFRVR